MLLVTSGSAEKRFRADYHHYFRQPRAIRKNDDNDPLGGQFSSTHTTIPMFSRDRTGRRICGWERVMAHSWQRYPIRAI
jgi:hypothetical protein